MAVTTYFVAMGLDRNDQGLFVAVDPVEALSEEKAISTAEALAKHHRGAVAFYRIGDPETGDFEDAILLRGFGDVPDDLTQVFA